MPDDSTIVTFRVNRELLRVFDAVAESNHRSRSAEIVTLMEGAIATPLKPRKAKGRHAASPRD